MFFRIIMDFPVSVRGVSKKYLLYESPQHRLKEMLLPFGKRRHRAFWALKDITFDLRRGQALGIMGRNGSGKSTLLQVICGILRPTNGQVLTRGRISALLELGAGFNPEYSGRSNVFMNLALMGFPKREIAERFEWIEKFADIGQFMDQPVKIYSSGMFVRLAFACAAIVDPDILVVDEALAVGDIFFQQKCFDKLREVIRRGTTCLFVSHDTAAMLNVCDEIMLLAEGEMSFKGPPQEAVSRYYTTMGNATACSPPETAAKPPQSVLTADSTMSAAEICAHSILSGRDRHGLGGIELIAARVTDEAGSDTLTVKVMDSLVLHARIRARQAASGISVGIHLFDRMANLVFASGTGLSRVALPDLAAGEELVVRLKVTFSVQPGEYTFSLGVSAPLGTNQDRHEMLGPIQVVPEDQELPRFYGIARLPLEADFYAPENRDAIQNVT
jgi:ABC-type polysaccharide/polyol phosphate transport system ATPase subunit